MGARVRRIHGPAAPCSWGAFVAGVILLAAVWPARAADRLDEPVFRDLRDQKRSLGELHGAPAVIEIWASWCGLCRPGLEQLDTIARAAPAGVMQALALSIDRDAAEARQFLAGNHPHAVFEAWFDERGEASHLFRIESLPALVVLDERGRIVERIAGDAAAVHRSLARIAASLRLTRRLRAEPQHPAAPDRRLEAPLVAAAARSG